MTDLRVISTNWFKKPVMSLYNATKATGSVPPSMLRDTRRWILPVFYKTATIHEKKEVTNAKATKIIIIASSVYQLCRSWKQGINRCQSEYV
jgi:hypothetical protein